MSGQCCASGSLHTGTPTGTIKKVHGLDCYVAEAPNGSPNGVVVIIPDAFGWALPNNRILADEYAKKAGSLVLLPDFMNGNVLPADLLISVKALFASGFAAQFYKIGHLLYLLAYFIPFNIACRPSVCRPRVFDFFKAVRSDEASNLKVATAGFCWGAKYVTELCWDEVKVDGKSLVNCGFIAHPSKLKFPDDIEKVAIPLSVANAEHDPQVKPDSAAAMKRVLEGKTAKLKDHGVTHEYVFYPGAHHGFAVRADEDDVEEAERGKKAEAQAVNWFVKWFGALSG